MTGNSVGSPNITTADGSALGAVDAVMILSFGGPEKPDDVMPFLRNVTRGRNVPDERLAVVAEQYSLFGGRSPINDQCRLLATAITDRLGASGHDLPVYFGARNWDPYVAETVQQMADDGIRRALVFVTSAFGTYSGCRQYQEDMARARATVNERAGNSGPPAPKLEKIRLFYNHPGFIEPMVDAVATGLAKLSDAKKVRVVFTAHSIPTSMAADCDYEAQLAEAARIIIDRVEATEGPGISTPIASDLVFQSRSGPPQIPWLEPDINDHLVHLTDSGVDGVVVVPLGFTSDHMEVVFDLDTKAAETAKDLELAYIRVPTVGTNPRYVQMIIDLIREVAMQQTPVAIGEHGPWPTPCPPNHCPPPQRRQYVS